MHYRLGSIGLGFSPFKVLGKEMALAKTLKDIFWLKPKTYSIILLQLKLEAIDWQCANNKISELNMGSDKFIKLNYLSFSADPSILMNNIPITNRPVSEAKNPLSAHFALKNGINQQMNIVLELTVRV